ncbi:MAG: ABC transporter ATP-binding protein [Actinobacteria bacterium]|jgi:branched-chain amino acid transport system ATP-binding protein|nr:ABC transporter ATP-binding protein [Actinomycetota bacterium]MCL5885935.1 ABC transporter ATP-binding protein [Actinomycetota bacterium]
MALLDVRDIYVSYGPYKALFGVSFSMEKGKSLGVLGTNGAGKSTLVRAISGLLSITSGSIVFDGKSITNWPAWKVARYGLGHVAEGRSVFATLSVRENLELAMVQSLDSVNLDESLRKQQRRSSLSLSRSHRRRSIDSGRLDEAYELFPRLKERRDQLAGTLSGGEQRMLSLATVVMAQYKLVMIDELSLGLSPAMVDEVYATLDKLNSSGRSLLLVEQHPNRIVELVDSVIVLSGGKVISSGESADIESLVNKLFPTE